MTVIDELVRLLQRELAAVMAVVRCAHALENAAATACPRLVADATAHLEDARRRLAALEVARAVSLTASGFSATTSASSLCDNLAPGRDQVVLHVVTVELRSAVRDAQGAIRRASAAVTSAG